MSSIESCLGEKLSTILIKLNADYQPEDSHYTADEIVFSLETCQLHILPIPETDELNVEVLSLEQSMGADTFRTLSEFDEFNDRTLSVVWRCVNTSGYVDLLALGFHQLHPSLLVLSEGGVLKLFETAPIKSNSRRSLK